ncbi:hemolin-like isoform X3 [Littorina saxatilis]|uniref:hemolin-like isoform X1 n=1 Tax=Littorina saxatilis TaxID=31220 RepID=UPI0038B512EA
MARPCILCVHLLLCVAFPESASIKYWPKSTPMEFDIPAPPHVIFPFTQITEYHSEGTRFDINCEAWGLNVTLKWLQDGSTISPTHAYITEHPDNGTLSFHGFTRRDEGYFQCRASNQYGVSLSHVVEVRQRVPPKFNNDVKNATTFTVQEGSGIALPCHDRPTLIPQGSYNWYNKTDTDQFQIHFRMIDRMDMDINGTLYITTVERSDAGDYYACAVQSDQLDKVSVAPLPYISLKVEKTKETKVIPTVLGWTGHVTADKGGEVTLECFFSGNPKPVITWRDGEQDTTIINGTGRRIYMSRSSHQLTISRLTDNDEGTYICEAENSKGSARASTFLNVTSRPLFEKESPQIIIAPTGRDATFSCVAKGAFREQPLAPPDWTINGYSIGPKQDEKISVSEDKTKLTVHNVTKDDVMSVQCNVSNSRGYAFGNGYLAVIDPLQIVSEPNKTKEVELGKTKWLNLTVKTTSDPCCPAKFAWYLNDQELPAPSLHKQPYSYKIEDNMATLSIRVDGPEEEVEGVMGKYRCKVFHEAYADSGKRNVTVDVKLKVLDKPGENLAQQIRGSMTDTQRIESGQMQSPRRSSWWIFGVIVIVFIIAVVLIVMILNCCRKNEYHRIGLNAKCDDSKETLVNHETSVPNHTGAD